MKRIMSMTMGVLFIISVACPAAFGGNGMGRGGGAGSGVYCTGPLLSCSGVVQTVTGVVVGYGLPGLVVDTGTSNEVFYGLGPVWYWERNNIDRPEIGETVTMETESVTIGETSREVMISITLGGQTLTLRDKSTCLPLWRGRRQAR